MATDKPYLFTKFGSWFHYLGAIIPLKAKFMATLIPFSSYILESCSNSFGISKLFIANIIATVFPSLFFIAELWYKYSGISILFFANIIAYVLPSLSYQEASLQHHYGGAVFFYI